MEWLESYEPRTLLLRIPKMLQKKFGEEEAQRKLDAYDFEARAELGISILSILFSGILGSFSASWSMDSPSSRKLADKYVTPALSEKVQSIGNPTWNRAWLRVLLFSLPAFEGETVDSSYEELFFIGRNLEHLCVLQLQTVVSMEPNKLRNLRASPESLLHNPLTLSSTEGPMAAAMFPTKQRPNEALYQGRSEPYPWNKKIRWSEGIRPLKVLCKSTDGETRMESVSQHGELSKLIKGNRELLVRFVERVMLPTIRNATGEHMEQLLDLILSRGSSAFQTRLDSNARSERKHKLVYDCEDEVMDEDVF
jgi:hypothetical protein